MHANADLINRFYTAFKSKDYASMQQCYADEATFTDEVFTGLNANEVKAMWEMLIKNGKDLQLEFSGIEADDVRGSANWVATYTFSKTGRKVVNRICAEFTFENGRIKTHRDYFSFYAWARQALGLSGLLLGWTAALRSKVQQTARKSLQAFMAQQAA